jgi:hypothetical protein
MSHRCMAVGQEEMKDESRDREKRKRGQELELSTPRTVTMSEVC